MKCVGSVALASMKTIHRHYPQKYLRNGMRFKATTLTTTETIKRSH